MKKVSVIIPTYNRCKNLKELVDSISACDYKDLEVVVVDNGSTDNTRGIMTELIQREKPGLHIKYLRLNCNLNASGGRYLGSKYATGDFLLFIDDDNIVLSDMITKLVLFSQQHDDAGLIAPCSLLGDNCEYVQNLGVWIDTVTSRCIFRKPSPIKISEIDNNLKYETLSALNSFMVTREAYQRSGGWDPNIGIMFDEPDLAMRIKIAGYKAFFVPDARCIHLGAKFIGEQDELRALGMGTPIRAYYFARNRSLFMRRYAKWYGKLLYFGFFFHCFLWYYLIKALKYRRFDIAKKYLYGSVRGIYCPKEIEDIINAQQLEIEEM